MRQSEFWQLMDDEFGRAYARTLARDQVLTALDGRTAEESLGAGVRARDVWLAVCDAMQVPEDRRLGTDLRERAARRDGGAA